MPPGPPAGAVPFICIPSGGVPEGLVPFISTPAGAVPDCSDDPAALAAGVAWTCSDDAGLDAADCVEELPESDVQPATRIPATRIADATNMMIMLLFMGYVSFLVSGQGSSLRPGPMISTGEVICHEDGPRLFYIQRMRGVKYCPGNRIN